jgi:hypothetical protein
MNIIGLHKLAVTINPDYHMVTPECDNGMILAHRVHFGGNIVRPTSFNDQPIGRFAMENEFGVLGVCPGDVVIVGPHKGEPGQIGVSTYPYKYWIRHNQHGRRVVFRGTPSAVASMIYSWHNIENSFVFDENGVLLLDETGVLEPQNKLGVNEAYILNEIMAAQFEDFNQFMSPVSNSFTSHRNQLTQTLFSQAMEA